MRKRKFTKMVGVLFDAEIYTALIKITDELEISISEYIRNIVVNELKKGEKNSGE